METAKTETSITSSDASAKQAVSFEPVFISAPFGNYVQPARCTATLGTFTSEARPGRVWRILKTVRYYPRLHAWVNKIGLRNPGLPWLVKQVQAGRKNVSKAAVSIHGFEADQWYALLDQLAAIRPLAIEMNMSCPNVGEVNWPSDLFTRAVATGQQIIVKIPPVRYEAMFEQAREAGITTFHCCNTLPVPAGGMSGKPLKPVSLMCIERLRVRPDADALTLIGGGGIYQPADVDDYVKAGVNYIAIGTKAMNPMVMLSHRSLEPIIERAHTLLSAK